MMPPNTLNPAFVVLALLSLLSTGCGLPISNAALAAPPAKLGLVVPATGPGQSTGTRMMRAVQLAVAERSRSGGVAGRPVELVIHDEHTPGGGLQASRRLAADPLVLAVTGHTTSESTDAVRNVYREAGLATVLLAAGPRQATVPNGGGILNLAPSHETEAVAAVQFAAETLKAESAAIVAGPDAGDLRRAASLTEAAQVSGLRLVHSDALFPSSTDYSGVVARLARTGPAIVFIVASLPSSAAFWREAAGTANAALILGTTASSAPEVAAIAGPAARTAYLPAIAPAVENADLGAFRAAYRKSWGEEPDPGALLAYDAAGLLLEAMEPAGRRMSAAPRAAVIEALAARRSYGGVSGRLHFTDSGQLEDEKITFTPAVH